MTSTLPLAKRTKQEILEEFEKMREKMDELQTAGKTIQSPATKEIVEKTQQVTGQSIDQACTDFQKFVGVSLSELRLSYLQQLEAFQQVQKAVDVSRQQLEMQYHIEVGAESVSRLVNEYEQKQREFDEQLSLKKREWEREREEYEYQKRLRQERDKREIEEREKALVERETAIRTQEQEITQMRKTIDQFPHEIEQALATKEQTIREQLTQQFGHEKVLFEKEMQGQVRMLELTVKHLEDRLALQMNELAALKQQAEEANAKAQTLAVKAIERPMTIVSSPAAAPSPQPSYQDRRSGGSHG
ncbi:hypothetical protein HY733_03245 [Candidatus Uhrbacteria bacterium]|nr:hypothetical protein [Candidatus Uhrbacteria bacterium]